MFAALIPAMTVFVVICVFVILLGLLVAGVRFYRKVEQGTALIRTGVGGVIVSFTGKLVFPIIHRLVLPIAYVVDDLVASFMGNPASV